MSDAQEDVEALPCPVTDGPMAAADQQGHGSLGTVSLSDPWDTPPHGRAHTLPRSKEPVY